MLVCFLVFCMYTYGARMLGVRARPSRRKQKGQGCKQDDASPRGGIFSRFGGLALPKWFSLSLSLSLFSRACIKVPLHVPFFIFLLLAWATFPRYGNVYFTFFVPYWAIPLKHWQCLLYFLTLCGCIVHDVCISISACIWAIVHFV